MNRNTSSESVVLTHRTFGEKNTLVKLFTQEFGIVDVVAYGARSIHSSLHVVNRMGTIGVAYLYMRKDRTLSKLIDFELHNQHAFAKDNILYFLHISLWIETLIATFGSGSEYWKSFSLLHAAITVLRGCATEAEYALTTARFLWKYLYINGICPDITHCAKCAASLVHANNSIYLDGHLYCQECYRTDPRNIQLDRYKKYSTRLAQYFLEEINTPFPHIVKNTTFIQMQTQIFDFIISITEHVIGHPLKSFAVIRSFIQ